MEREVLRYRLAVAAAFVAALGVRLAAATLAYLPDDSFMYFDTARTLAGTGRLATSGIQPLYLLLLTPVYAIMRPETVARLDAAAYASVLVCVAGDLVALVLLATLLRRAFGPLAAAVGAWAWALHPGVVGFAVNGLETSWAVAALLAVAVAARGRRDALTGALVGVAMLARIDLAVAGAAVALFVVLDARREAEPWRVVARRGAALAAGWAPVYLPWLAFQVMQTGDLLPVSGPASRIRGLDNAADFNEYGGPPYETLMCWIAFLSLAFSAPLFALAAPAFARLRALRELRVVGVYAAATMAYYTLFHKVWWYLPRYLVAWLVLEVALVAAGLAALRRGRWVALAATAAVLVAGLAGVRRQQGSDVMGSRSLDYHAAAVAFAAAYPPDARLAASESGALGYYMPGRVVNLDGVTNRDAYLALKANRLSAYLRGEDLWYFAAVPHERSYINLHSAEHVYYAPVPPLTDQFQLYRIDAPSR